MTTMTIIKALPLVLLISLTGCQLTGPSVHVSGPKITVDDNSNNSSKHCPPGQAKKGNC
ncbi:MAG: hypothetical protein ACJAZP_001284 [Psychromonas sp.]|jgi:hypothetical protein|uniref:hypothetical protein n=1 Tax=Psychromonas sp. TaxID=1884585 RepID=UPI0039E6B158